jgi:uncharacterized protein involved in exopolysaccharide biosynthesis
MTMQNDNMQTASETKQISSLADVFLRSFLRCKWFVGAGLIVGMASGYLSLIILEPTYKGVMTVTSSSSGREGMSLQQINGGNTGKLLSFNFGEQETLSKFAISLQLVSSVRLAQVLEDKYQISHQLLAMRQDPKTGEWERPQGLLSKISPFPRSPVSSDLIARVIAERVKVKTIASGVFQLSFIDQDAKFANDFLEMIYVEVENLMVKDALVESQRSADYLREVIDRSTHVENRKILIGLLRDTQRELMLLNIGTPYAWRQIDPPYVPILRDSPTKKMAFAVMIATAAFFWLLGDIVFRLRDRRARRKSDAV